MPEMTNKEAAGLLTKLADAYADRAEEAQLIAEHRVTDPRSVESWQREAQDRSRHAQALRLAVKALARPHYCGECVKFCRYSECQYPGDASAWKAACEQFKGNDHAH
jgi:hypothetical protein